METKGGGGGPRNPSSQQNVVQKMETEQQHRVMHGKEQISSSKFCNSNF